MAVEAGEPPRPAPAGVDVEEDAGNGDHVALKGGAEEVDAVGDRLGQAPQRDEEIEGAVRLPVHAHPHLLGALEHQLALGAEGGADRRRLGQDPLRLQQRHRRPLEGLRAAPVEEGAGALDGLDHLPGGQGPGHPPAGVAPVLGEAVQDDHRVAVHVLHPAGGAHGGARLLLGAAPDEVRVELVEDQRALEPPADVDPARQLVARDQLAHGVAGVRHQQCSQPASQDLALQVGGGEAVARLPAEQDGDGGHQPEDLQQLLVGGVVGQEVPEVDVPERRHRAGEAGAAAAGDGHVLGRVLRRHAAAVEPVVEAGHRLAQLPESRDRGVLVVAGVDAQAIDSLRSARERPRLGLALAQVAPVGVAGAVAPGRRQGRDVDHAGAGHGAKGRGPAPPRGGGSSTHPASVARRYGAVGGSTARREEIG